VFSRLDMLAQKHGLEKIKTIGDAYMAAAGLPVPRPDHAEAIARFAIDLFTEIESIQEMVEGPINLRVGIDSGPVIAGIIGRNKFSYDLWGDTVNIASRMESNGLAGKIQVSENTWNILKDKFSFTERGEIEIKGKGSMRSWILEP
ncbi:MAG: adenylate/guanylate cyclase domain-containing protein, partial [Verrucomicrobiales bacterium]